MTSQSVSKNITIIVDQIISTIMPKFFSSKLEKNPKAAEQLSKALGNCSVTRQLLSDIIQTNLPNTIVKTSKGFNKPKDKLAPKKNKTAYIIFCSHHRPKIIQENSDLKQPEIMKKLGELWSKTKGTAKVNPFIKQAEEDKLRYQSEMEDYQPSEEFLEKLEDFSRNPEKYVKKTRQTKTTKTKDSNKPKKPMTSYFRFASRNRQDIKENNPDMSHIELTRELSRVWKNDLSEEEKNIYTQEYKLEMIDYNEKMKLYEQSEQPEESVGGEEQAPKKSKKKSKTQKSEERVLDEEQAPKKSKKSKTQKSEESDGDEEQAPKKSKTRKSKESDGDDEEQAPKKSKKSKTQKSEERVWDQEQAPKKSKKSKTQKSEESVWDEEQAPKKSKKSKTQESEESVWDEEQALKKSKKKSKTQESEESVWDEEQALKKSKKKSKTQKLEKSVEEETIQVEDEEETIEVEDEDDEEETIEVEDEDDEDDEEDDLEERE